jgi:hypothetical protein
MQGLITSLTLLLGTSFTYFASLSLPARGMNCLLVGVTYSRSFETMLAEDFGVSELHELFGLELAKSPRIPARIQVVQPVAGMEHSNR